MTTPLKKYQQDIQSGQFSKDPGQAQASLLLEDLFHRLIDENKPKCYLCHEQFENMDELKKHQELRHKEFFAKFEKGTTS